MPGTREIKAESADGTAPDRGPGLAILRGSGAFGEVAGLARQVLAHPGIVVVIGTGWESAPDAIARLESALELAPHAAFAFGDWIEGPKPPPGGDGASIRVDAEGLICRPSEFGPLAIRSSEAARLGWPDFGPPDLVLDAAATWALAAALAIRGAMGVFVPGAWSRRIAAQPESMDRLRPEGLAWLVSCALGWGPEGRPPAVLAERLWRRWTGEMIGAGFDGLTPPGAGAR